MKHLFVLTLATSVIATGCQTTSNQPCSPTSASDSRVAMYGSQDAYNFIRSATAETDKASIVRIATAGLALPTVTNTTKHRLLRLRADANFQAGNPVDSVSDYQKILDDGLAIPQEAVWIDTEIARIKSGAQPNTDGPLPLVRIPPRVPPRANKSGHCQLRFDVLPDGSLINSRADYCTDSLFEAASLSSVENWKYETSEAGVQDFHTNIRFVVLNRCGVQLPE